MGNGLADHFARQGDIDHKLPNIDEEVFKMQSRQHGLVAQHLAWAMRRVLKVGGWDPEAEFVKAVHHESKIVATVVQR
eukprot:4585886-Pyramimonas_sp.AAC.1